MKYIIGAICFALFMATATSLVIETWEHFSLISLFMLFFGGLFAKFWHVYDQEMARDEQKKNRARNGSVTR